MALLTVLPTSALGASSRFLLVSAEFGARGFSHYTPEQMPRTPPRTLFMEPMATVSFGDMLGAYAFYGSSFSGAAAREYGVGLRLLINRYVSPKSFVGTLKLELLLEAARYSIDPPLAPAVYQTSGLQVRYGPAAKLFLSANWFYVDVALLATRFSDNWCIAPFLGIGANVL